MDHRDVDRYGASEHRAGVHAAVRSAEHEDVVAVAGVGRDGGEVAAGRTVHEEERSPGTEHVSGAGLGPLQRAARCVQIIEAAHLAHVGVENLIPEYLRREGMDASTLLVARHMVRSDLAAIVRAQIFDEGRNGRLVVHVQ